MNASSESDPGSAVSPEPKPVQAKSSAVKAGWICLALGLLTFWIFGLGFAFFIATFVIAIIAMCTNRIGHGILLLLASVVSPVVCLMGIFTLASHRVHAAPHKALTHQVRQEVSAHDGVTLDELLGPKECSLRVNINTAFRYELESLPGIGFSKAERIISHRPYESAEDLIKVPGIGQRMLQQIRPFVKTDGPTEKIEGAK